LQHRESQHPTESFLMNYDKEDAISEESIKEETPGRQPRNELEHDSMELETQEIIGLKKILSSNNIPSYNKAAIP